MESITSYSPLYGSVSWFGYAIDNLSKYENKVIRRKSLEIMVDLREEFERIKGEEYVKWIESQDTYTPNEWVDYLSKRK